MDGCEKSAVDPDSTLSIKSSMHTAGKLRIAHLIATNFFGGPEKQIIEHLKLLNSSRFSGMVFSFIEDGLDSEILAEAQKADIACQGFPMSNPLDFAAWRRLREAVRDNAVNLLCVHGYKSTVMGLWVHKTLKVPTLAFSRGYTAENKKVAFYQYLDRLSLRHVSGVVCVSDGQRRALEKLGARAKRLWVVHNAIHTPDAPCDATTYRSQVSSRFGLPLDAIWCVTAGRMSPEKGHRDLIQAIALMGEHAARCYFLFCGDGSCKAQLEKQAQALNLEDRIRFAGFRKDIQDIFQAMDMLILPSHSEGLPNVVLEAFSFGKAVVATSAGGVPELVENGKSGILVPPKDPKLLAAAITKCAEDAALRKALGIAARDTTRLRFNFADQAKRLESIYAEILGSKPV
jgi:glycosyltransferase involved in cell wall biosynthesis